MIIGGLLVRNEADRWLTEFLESYSILCDKIVVLNDASTDNTVEICSRYTDIIYDTTEHTFIKNESVLRKTLWDKCCNNTKLGDWIAIFDADELIHKANAKYLNEFVDFGMLENAKLDLIALRLFDMWNDKQYRSDDLWNAHTRAFPFLARYIEKDLTFSNSPIHCGRFPTKVLNYTCGILENVYVKHMGWSTEKDRLNKFKRYMDVDPDGVYGSLEQYKSILDKNPKLEDFLY
jgi:glycosyltransferase involved in cell wall biosynthesis